MSNGYLKSKTPGSVWAKHPMIDQLRLPGGRGVGVYEPHIHSVQISFTPVSNAMVKKIIIYTNIILREKIYCTILSNGIYWNDVRTQKKKIRWKTKPVVHLFFFGHIQRINISKFNINLTNQNCLPLFSFISFTSDTLLNSQQLD